jgi:hypothetical protein
MGSTPKTEEQKALARARARRATARWRARNQGRINAKRRTEYAANPEPGRRACSRWRAAHPQQAAARTKRWREANREKALDASMRCRFKIGLEQYTAMFEAQSGRCAICRNPERVIDHHTKRPRRLAVDHCHKTGRIRGLLCHDCNVAIGLLRECRAYLEAAIEYLERFREG